MSERQSPADETALLPRASTAGDFRVHLAYANTYRVGMASLGFQTVYRLLASEPGVAVDRVFWREDVPARSALKTYKDNRTLADCDVLAFSLSFEGDYPCFTTMLHQAGLLFRSAKERFDRAEGRPDFLPLLIAGGPAATLNPEPIADFLDAVMLGEAEEFIPEFIAVLRQAKRECKPRPEVLWRLRSIPGIYVPAMFAPRYAGNFLLSAVERVRSFDPKVLSPEPPRRRFVRSLSKHPANSVFLCPAAEFGSMFLVETGRGCPQRCRFCACSAIYRPIRRQSEERLMQMVRSAPPAAEAVGFVGAAVSSHPGICQLLDTVCSIGKRGGLSSLAAQDVTEALARRLVKARADSVALAPEAGSERLRFLAGKRVPDTIFIQAAASLGQQGLTRLKLYFMVGLPGETPEDIDAISKLTFQIEQALCDGPAGKGLSRKIILSVNSFVPKPWTPLQWAGMPPLTELRQRQQRIRTATRHHRRIQVKFESPRESVFQAMLSRGDRRLSPFLYESAAGLHDWKWMLSQARKRKMGQSSLLDFYAARRRSLDEVLPWDHLEQGIKKQFLADEFEAMHWEIPA